LELLLIIGKSAQELLDELLDELLSKQ